MWTLLILFTAFGTNGFLWDLMGSKSHFYFEVKTAGKDEVLLTKKVGTYLGLPLESPGAPVSRIIGGEDAPENYAPFMVSLMQENQFFLLQVCGGSIVTRRLVLTAAHCITPFVQDREIIPSFYGRIGSNIWFSGGTVITFLTHHIHPDWDEENIKNDVGLLVAREPIVLGEHLAVIRLNPDFVGENVLAHLFGWGRTGPRFENDTVNFAPTPDRLQHLIVSTISMEQCKVIFSRPGLTAPPLDKRIELCTFHSVGHGACIGDSGSPLVDLLTGQQIAIVSWGNPCAMGDPDVFARVSAGMQFLRTTLDKYQ